jgi:isocitrate dehydrogenase
MATLFAWTGALKKRGQLDAIPELTTFADILEKAAIATIEDGCMTKDLALITDFKDPKVVTTREFIVEIRRRLDRMLVG